jgi:hypothetical protein
MEGGSVMSQSETPEVRRVSVQDAECQFPLRKAMDDVLDELIEAGADKVTLLQESDLTRSQLRNVVNVAAGTRSREAVTNFVRYQMGRQGGRAWLHSAPGRKAFGREVISDIESEAERTSAVDAATRKVCGAVQEQLRQRNLATDEKELEREVRAQVTALYLGYLNRTFAYCEAMRKTDATCWEDVARVAGREEGGQ